MIRVVRFVLLAALAGLVGVIGLRGYRDGRAGQLDEFGSVGEFTFTGADGRPVTDRDLTGKVCVFACFFTCCTETCPAISGSMARLQAELADLSDVRLVSLTVDPEHDTPEKLSEYAAKFGANPGRWLFLTGTRDDVELFVTRRLLQGVERNTGPAVEPGNRVLHSERLVLADRTGRVRGFFAGTDANGVDDLIRAVRTLH